MVKYSSRGNSPGRSNRSREFKYISQFCCSVVSNFLWSYGLQHTRLLCTSLIPGAWSNSCPCYPPSHPLSSPSPPAFTLSQLLGLFQWVSSSHQVAKILELQLQLNIYLMENLFFKCLKRNSSLRLIIIFMYMFVSIWSNVWTVVLAFCCSVAKLCLTPCDPMDCSKAGSPVFHYLLEFAQTHVHWVSDAIWPSHPLQSLSSFAFNLCQNPGLLQWVCSLYQLGKVLELQPLSFQRIFRHWKVEPMQFYRRWRKIMITVRYFDKEEIT